MFEETTPPNKPTNVEDIFAKAEPPTMPARGYDRAPSIEVSPTTSAWQVESVGQSRRWLIYVVAGLVILGIIFGGWYAWTKFGPNLSSEPATETTEVNNEISNPVNNETAPAIQGDIDGDGLTDSEESALGTDPRRADSDEDGLFDREETRIYQSNPLQFDSDGDGYSDGQEVQNGYSPVGAGRLLQLPTPTTSE